LITSLIEMTVTSEGMFNYIDLWKTSYEEREIMVKSLKKHYQLKAGKSADEDL